MFQITNLSVLYRIMDARETDSLKLQLNNAFEIWLVGLEQTIHVMYGFKIL